LILLYFVFLLLMKNRVAIVWTKQRQRWYCENFSLPKRRLW
jgi:hypothetical protein